MDLYLYITACKSSKFSINISLRTRESPIAVSYHKLPYLCDLFDS